MRTLVVLALTYALAVTLTLCGPVYRPPVPLPTDAGSQR